MQVNDIDAEPIYSEAELLAECERRERWVEPRFETEIERVFWLCAINTFHPRPWQ